MKIRHKVPSAPLTSDPISAEYQREVDRATQRSERAYRAAQSRLDAAIARAARAEAVAKRKSAKAKEIRAWQTAEALVELRRIEMEKYERIMRATAAPSSNRGRESFRPVPTSNGGLT
jgi:hypothetical protein